LAVTTKEERLSAQVVERRTLEGKVVGAMAERGLDQVEVSRRKAVEVVAMVPVLKTKDEKVPIGEIPWTVAMAAAAATMDKLLLAEETTS
jgi:hypothetical protein